LNITLTWAIAYPFLVLMLNWTIYGDGDIAGITVFQDQPSESKRTALFAIASSMAIAVAIFRTKPAFIWGVIAFFCGVLIIYLDQSDEFFYATIIALAILFQKTLLLLSLSHLPLLLSFKSKETVVSHFEITPKRSPLES
jgi:bacteriorhodopsin